MAEKSAYEKLSKKQRDFVDVYLGQGIGRGNATKAAVEAGYSEHTARQQGSRLLSNVDIQAAIKDRVNEMKIGADEVLVRMAMIARGNLGDFIELGYNNTWRFNLEKARLAGLLGLLKKVKQKTIRQDEDTWLDSQEIELYDAQAALNTLMRHLGLLGPTGTKDDPLHVELDDAKDSLAHLAARYAERTGADKLDSEPDAGAGADDPL